LKQAAARNNRRSKSFDPDLIRTQALEKEVRHGYEAQRLVAQARERLPIQLSPYEIAVHAREAVIFARKKAVENEAVADLRKVIGDALRRCLGLTRYDAVMTELQRQMETRGGFLKIRSQQGPPAVTTDPMLAMEKQNIQTMIDGKESRPAMVEAERVKELVTTTAERQQRRLNAQQRSAIEAILSSRDQIIGLQGGAGTGKTTALSVLREAAEKEGYQVRGFAPSTRAAQQLGESGIETETIQKFLRRRKQPATASRLFVVDESSLASTKHIHNFLALQQPEDKVLFVGDVRQHQAVEAGRPFEQLQQHGMTTVALSENVRQRNKELKQSVHDFAARNIREAVDELHSRGKVIEIADEQERFAAIAQDYCKDPTGTLVISPANRERVQLNSLIHRQLQREGNVSQNEYQMKIYVTRSDMTGEERTFANSYRPGEDIIRYNRNSNKAKVGEYARVLATDHERNEITVQFENGRLLKYNPKRLSGVSVYYEAERAFAEGDRVQFRAPDTQKRIVNGELGTITRIDPAHIRLALDSGREISIDPRKFRHLDYGYAVTSYSAQGLTCDRVLVNADTRESVQLLNDRMAYVAISRARYEALIYTDSAQNLGLSLERSTNKETAIEATQQQLPFDHSLAHTSTHPEPAPTKAAELTTTIPIEISRARYEVPTPSVAERNLSETLNRATSKDTALEGTLDDDREMKKDRDKLTRDPLAPQQSSTDHSLNQATTHTNSAPTKAAELEKEAPEIDLGGLVL